MATRYRNQFYSLAGVYWQIDLWDTSYSGSVNMFKTDSAGFSMNYKGVTERLDPILACDGSVHAIVEDTLFEAFMNDIATSQENRFGVVIYKNGVQSFAGPILPDQGTFKDEYYPYDYDIKFSDGLGLLKDVDYSNFNVIAPAPVTGVELLMTIILRCLSKTQTQIYFSGSQGYIKTVVNWYDIHHNQLNDPLNTTKLDNSIFYSFNNDTSLYEFKSCYDVLKMILTTFNARILQTEGVFVIIQSQEYSFATSYSRLYTKTNGLVTQNWADNFRLTGAQRMAGGITKYYPALLEVTKYYTYEYTNNKGNLIPPGWAFPLTTPTNFLNTIPCSCVIGLNTTTYLWHFSGTIHVEFYCAANFSGFVKTHFKIQVHAVDATSGYDLYLTNEYPIYESPMRWLPLPETTDAVRIQSDASFSTNLANPYVAQDIAYDFYAPPIFYKEMQGNIQWINDGLFYTNGSPVGAPSSGLPYSLYVTLQEPSLVIEANDGTAFADGKLMFQSVNMSGGLPVQSTFKLDLPDTLIGDNFPLHMIGRLQVYSGSAWYWASSWGVHNSTNRNLINQLSVDQNLGGQKNPVDKFSGKFMSPTISPLKAIVWGSKIMVPIVFNFFPDVDEASGEWFNLQPMAL